MKKRVTALLLAVILLLSLSLPAMAASGAHITATQPQPQSTTAGSLLAINLETVFSDPEGHSLTYSLSGGDFGTQTKIANDPGGHPTLYFSVAAAGEYRPVVTVSCVSGDTASATFDITVEAGAEGRPSQYNYDETPDSSVTVYVTISSDGVPIVGTDGTPLAHLEVTLPYFDLDNQDLSEFYRYHTEGGKGSYVDTEIVQRPTVLHLYLYMLGVYYLGYDPADIVSGDEKVYGASAIGNGVQNILGTEAYSDTTSALDISGSPTSLYMQAFWGHDENLMYFRNHEYPLMDSGWGSTADYVLLSDGDTIDVAMFSNWSFWGDGAFLSFDQDSYSVAAGDTLSFQTREYSTGVVMSGGSDTFDPVEGVTVLVCDDTWQTVDFAADDGGGDGSFTFSEAGTYYLLAMDPNGGTSDSKYAPATAKVVVTSDDASAVTPGDVDGDGVVTVQDAALAYRLANGLETPTERRSEAADVNADGAVTVVDANLIYQLVNNKVTAFPTGGTQQ